MRPHFASLLLLLVSSPVLADPPAGFAKRVEALRATAGIPGLGIAIVENGRPTFVRGFGVRQLGMPGAVDADTIFAIGSTTKAMTAAALATLVDAGKISWDDRVIDYLPGFQMYDPWVTREMRVRDLLVHRSGLGYGAGDLLFVPRSTLSRAETVRRIRFIKPSSSFRSEFAYSNLMYVVAGQLVEAVSGQTWEDYLRQHIFAPAGMSHATSDNGRRFATLDRAYPHARMDGGLRGLGHQERLDEQDDLGRNAAPAGGVAASPNDLAAWIEVELNGGKAASGTRVFSNTARDEMWKPVIVQPIIAGPEALRATQPSFSSYALGWDVEDYHGTKFLWHGGAVLGFKSAVVLIPSKNIGFAIQINSEEGEVIRGLIFELLDHYLGLPKGDWPAAITAVRQGKLHDGLMLQQAALARPAGAPPSVPLDRFVGTYRDPWYGDVVVARDKAGLTIDFRSTPRMSGRLRPYRYNSFVTDLTDKSIEPATVNFALDSEGKVERMTMQALSPVADFSWDYRDLDFRPVEMTK